ncbi:MAG: MarR family transcriptional regulator [Ferruginibacter sp.]|nr:MarR family transcriptional regulator [Ferruginibacter sp.]
MSLEKDINQAKFSNEHHKVMINIIFTANWVNEKLKPIFDKENITQQQYNILRILRGAKEPISTLQIRERMLDKMSDTSRIVDRLIVKELAKKKVCSTDKRLVDVSISAKGIKLLQKLDGSQQLMEDSVKAISKKDAKMINDLLDKLRG